MKKVLILTRQEDPHADLVIDELNKNNQSFFRLNTDVIYQYDISIDLSGCLIVSKISGLSVHTSDIKSVYLRRRCIPEGLPFEGNSLTFAQSEWRYMLYNIMASLKDVFWINKPDSNDSTLSKIDQLKIAKQIGFNVPDTIITNSKEAIIHNEIILDNCLYKPFNGGFAFDNNDEVLYSNLVGKEYLKQVEPSSLGYCPGIFQKYIEKEYELRVTVIGSNVIAARIDSQLDSLSSVDCRANNLVGLKHSLFQLSEEDKKRCLLLCARYNLYFGAIDLIQCKNGNLFFLEINSNGQWAWIQTLTGARISEYIANALMKSS